MPCRPAVALQKMQHELINPAVVFDSWHGLQHRCRSNGPTAFVTMSSVYLEPGSRKVAPHLQQPPTQLAAF